MKESPLFWPAHIKGNTLFVLDETLIPKKIHYIKVRNTREAVKVIRDMKTRAFGQFLVVLNTFLLELNKMKKEFNADNRGLHADGRGSNPRKSAFDSRKSALNKLQEIATALNNSRPTFPFSEVTGIVLHWTQVAQEQKMPLVPFLEKNINGFLMGIRAKRLGRVKEIAQLIQNGERILTHCNVSGELAMAAGICRDQNKKVHFFATETRPYFQGSKLTCWELKKMGANVTLVADNAVGSLLMDGLVDRVVIGSDRSCANGDIANKIGSYQIAVLAKEFGIPLYALTQPSNKVKDGKEIPLELRDPEELLNFENKRIVPGKVKGFYPGFDVVPNELIERSISISVN